MPRALILGVGGQDGSYLAEVLLERSYEVHGVHPFWDTLQNLQVSIPLHVGDLQDLTSTRRILQQVKFDEIYNMADIDRIALSKELPKLSFATTAAAVAELLEMLPNSVKFFQPLSATMFGNAPPPQNEETPLYPLSPYACAKASAFHLCRYYRSLGKLVYTGIMYNHTSSRQSEDFLLPKICWSAARIARCEVDHLDIGCLNQVVDIGYAKEYMEAAHAVMQGDPDDYIVASNSQYTVKQLCEMAFDLCKLNIDVDWVRSENKPPTMPLIGDIDKIRRIWQPKTTGRALCELVLSATLQSKA